MTLSRFVLDPVSGLAVIRGPDNPVTVGADAAIGSAYVNDTNGTWAVKFGPADTDWAVLAATSGFLPLTGGSLNPGAGLTVPGAFVTPKVTFDQSFAAASAVNTASAGTKLELFPGSSTEQYRIGVGANADIWFQAINPTIGGRFRFYAGVSGVGTLALDLTATVAAFAARPTVGGIGVVLAGENVTTATTAANLANFINQSGGRTNFDFNAQLQTGFYNFADVPTNGPAGMQYGQLIVAKGIDTGMQITGGYANDELYFRGWGASGGTWYTWRRLLHSGNYASFALPLGGGALSGLLDLAATGLRVGGFDAGVFTNAGLLFFGVRSTGAGLTINYSNGNGSFSSNLNIANQLQLSGALAASIGGGTYLQLSDPSGNTGIHLGNLTDPRNYYNNTEHYFRNRSSVIQAILSNTIFQTNVPAYHLADGIALALRAATAGTGVGPALYMAFQNSAAARRGYIGYGGTSDSSMYVTNDQGVIYIAPDGAAPTAYFSSTGLNIGQPLVVNRPTGQSHINFTTSGNADVWMSGSGTFRLINGAYTAATFSVDNIGNTRSIGYLSSGGFLRSDTGLQMPGGGYIYTTGTSGTSYQNAIQVREFNGGGAQGSTMPFAPRLAFHWSGVVASSIAMEPNGRIAIYDNPGTGYESFVAAGITAVAAFHVNTQVPLYNDSYASYVRWEDNQTLGFTSAVTTGGFFKLRNSGGTGMGYFGAILAEGFGLRNDTGSWQVRANIASTGGDFTGSWAMVSGSLNLNRVINTANSSIAYYAESVKAWREYMAPPGAGQGPAGITPSSGTFVNNWAIHSYVEGFSGYGWVWETSTPGGNINTVAPTTVMELTSGSNGPFNNVLKVWGDVVARRSSNQGVVYFGDNTAYIYYTGSIFDFGNQNIGGTGNVTVGLNLFVNTNGLGYGLQGVYDQTKYRLVYAMGAGSMATNGTNLGNLYGLFYAYDATSGGQNITGHTMSHGVGVSDNGVARSFMGWGGFWTAGNSWVGGSVTATDFIISSDGRLKQNLQVIDRPLDRLRAMTGYTYELIADPRRRRSGVIAQQVRAVIPEAVFQDDTGMLSVAYDALVPVLIEGLKELHAEVTELKRKYADVS